MMTLLPLPKFKAVDNNNNPLVGGFVWTYAAGTSTPQATYTDATGATQNTNPVVLDSRGEAAIWVGTLSYKIIVQDSLGNTIYTADNVQAIADGSVNENKLTASVAGKGLKQDTNKTLAVNYDDLTINLSASNQVQVKDNGITTSKILDGAVTASKIPDNSIPITKLISNPVNKASARHLTTFNKPTLDTTQFTITAISRANNIVTLTVTGIPGISQGQICNIQGITTSSFNANLLCLTNPSASTYTFYQPGPDATGVLGAAPKMTGQPFWVPFESLSISAITRTSNVVTVTVISGPVPARVGQRIIIEGSTGASTPFNGIWTVTSVPSSTSFTFNQTGPNEFGAGGTGSIRFLMGVQLTASGVAGRYVEIGMKSGYISQSIPGSNSVYSFGIYTSICKPVAGDFGVNISANALGIFDSINQVTSTGATYSSGTGVTYPVTIEAIDYEPPAGTYEYYFVHQPILANLSDQLNNLAMLAHEVTS